MMTPFEKEMVKTAHEALENATQLFEVSEVPPEFMSIVVGSLMAAIDAVFAIREGEPWRGITDPQEIAKELIRMAGMTDQN